MKEKHYGTIIQNRSDSPVEQYAEEISIRGFTIVEGAISQNTLEAWRTKIDDVYVEQETKYSKDKLAAIQELDMCRAPLLYDKSFLDLAQVDKVLEIVSLLLGQHFILSLQNAIINRPDRVHHQTSWHRDLPHQNYVSTRPLSVTALFAIDEFTLETGATHVVPFSHKLESMPSEAYLRSHTVSAVAPAGSVIIFDSMLFHRAGENTSTNIRRAVNHMYTIPIMKQQYDFPNSFRGSAELTSIEKRLLGFDSRVPVDDQAWRDSRLISVKNNT